MLADSLRKSILQAAIEGKLTQREPGDGDARDLLAEIQEEKARLVKEGKIRRAAPLPPVDDDEIPFDIPDNWCWVRLGEIGSTHIGLTYKPSDVKEEGITVLRSSNIQDGKICLNDVVKVKCDIPDTKMCQVNDLLICARNGSKKLVGKAAIIQQEGFSFGAFMAIFRTPFYAYTYYYLLSPLFRDDLEKVGTTTINQITHANLNMRMFPLPPLAEQRRIVARLEELLPLVDVLANDERELEAIEREFPDAIRKSLLQAAIEGKLTKREPGDGDARDLLAEIQKEKARLVKEGKIRRSAPLPPVADDEIPFDIPDNWRWVRLGECISLLSGQDLTPTAYNDQSEGVPYITGASNFQNGEITINRWTTQPKAVSRQGDILLTCKGTVGEVAFLKVKEAHIARQIMAITPILIDVRYLANSLKFYVGELKQKAKSIIPGIERKNVLNMVVPLPPLAEQRRIVARLEELLPLADELGKL